MKKKFTIQLNTATQTFLLVDVQSQKVLATGKTCAEILQTASH